MDEKLLNTQRPIPSEPETRKIQEIKFYEIPDIYASFWSFLNGSVKFCIILYISVSSSLFPDISGFYAALICIYRILSKKNAGALSNYLDWKKYTNESFSIAHQLCTRFWSCVTKGAFDCCFGPKISRHQDVCIGFEGRYWRCIVWWKSEGIEGDRPPVRSKRDCPDRRRGRQEQRVPPGELHMHLVKKQSIARVWMLNFCLPQHLWKKLGSESLLGVTAPRM